MAIEKVPFNLSEVVKEFGSSSIKDCGDKAGLTTPFKCTEFVGKSDRASMTINIGYSSEKLYEYVGYSTTSKMGKLITAPTINGVKWNVTTLSFTVSKSAGKHPLVFGVSNDTVYKNKDVIILEINSRTVSLDVREFLGTLLVSSRTEEESKLKEIHSYFMANRGKNIDIFVEHVKS